MSFKLRRRVIRRFVNQSSVEKKSAASWLKIVSDNLVTWMFSLSLSRRKNMYLIMPASLTRNGWVIRFNDIRFSLSRIFRMDGLGMFIWNYDGIHTTTRWWKSDTLWLLENDNFSISSLAHDPRVPFSPINLRRITVSAFRWGGTFIANIIISGQNEWTWRASFELNSISHYNQTMY